MTISQETVVVRERQEVGWVDVGVSSQVDDGQREVNMVALNKTLDDQSTCHPALLWENQGRKGRTSRKTILQPAWPVHF